MNTSRISSTLQLAAVFSTAILLGTSNASAAEAPQHCLQITDIANTKIIDDQNIVFKTRSNKFYNNHLPIKCAGLKSADKFSYKTSLSKLCNVDIITVLESSGASIMNGGSCGLGDFTPTTDPAKKPKTES